MVSKCANPVCLGSFRKLGTGKLFAFESVTSPRSADIMAVTNRIKTGGTPAFFWLCETCSLLFTLELDAAGQLTLQRVPDGMPVPIFDRPLDKAG